MDDYRQNQGLDWLGQILFPGSGGQQNWGGGYPQQGQQYGPPGGFPPGQGGFAPGQGGFPPGQGGPPGPPPGQGGQGGPPGPPPQSPPGGQQYGGGPSVFAVDPGSMYRCLYRYTWVRLNNGRTFWFYPTFIGRTSVAGYRWRRRQYRWVYYGLDTDRIASFSCQ